MSPVEHPWPWLDGAPKVNGVYRLGLPGPVSERYANARAREKRLLSDEQVRILPTGRGLWNASEWTIRAQGAERLGNLLRPATDGLRILEVGCGNGWLSALLQRDGHKVLGLDPFTDEVEQAARVFTGGPAFAIGEFLTTTIPVAVFDVVLFPASIQYFEDLEAVITKAISLLRPGGTIHVFDSVLYGSATHALAAKQRSAAYFTRIGVPEMAEHYHCHSLEVFNTLGHVQVLHRPLARWHWTRLLGSPATPFTHLTIAPR